MFLNRQRKPANLKPASDRRGRRASQAKRNARIATFEPLEERVLLSHFRYGNLTWEPVGGNTVGFHFQQAWRRSAFGGTAPDGLPAVGDIVFTIPLDFGDGKSSFAALRVLSINTRDDFFVGETVTTDAFGNVISSGLTHPYSPPGTYIPPAESVPGSMARRSDRCKTMHSMNSAWRPSWISGRTIPPP